MQAEAEECESLLAGVELEGVADIVQGLHDVDLSDTEAQRVVLEFVEVHQLVHELEHPLYAALGDGEQRALRGVERSTLGKLGHGARDHGEGGAELMGDIGKETYLTGCATGRDHATGVVVEIGCQQTSQQQIDEPRPPGPGWRRGDQDTDCALVADRLVVGTVGGTYAEGVAA